MIANLDVRRVVWALETCGIPVMGIGGGHRSESRRIEYIKTDNFTIPLLSAEHSSAVVKGVINRPSSSSHAYGWLNSRKAAVDSRDSFGSYNRALAKLKGRLGVYFSKVWAVRFRGKLVGYWTGRGSWAACCGPMEGITAELSVLVLRAEGAKQIRAGSSGRPEAVSYLETRV